MSETVWDQEFFRRRAAGEQAAGHATEPAAATPPAPGHATIAGLLLARAGDDNTALLFEGQRWSWRELVQEAATRSALMRQLRPREPRERPWHVGAGPRSAVHAAPAVHVRIDGSAEGGDLLHRPVGVHMPGQPDQIHL